MNNITITTKVDISHERIANLLCSALDTGCGGSWYWIWDYKYTKGTDAQYWHDIPLHGGKIELDIRECENDPAEWYVLNLASIEKGLVLMEEKFHDYHWNNFITENDDAETADVFLQLCLFNKVLIG